MGDKKAGSRAAKAQNKLLQAGINQLRPFSNAGAFGVRELRGGSTVGGLDQRIGEILNSDIFGNLVDQRTRDVQGQLSAAGLMRSGAGLQAASNIGSDLALELDNLLAGRQTALAGMGPGSAGVIADLLKTKGENTGSGIIADAQAKGAAIGDIVGIASKIFFSDPRLKTNVEKVGEIRGLGVYEWDWIPQAKGTVIEKCDNVGFMADEVERKYPHHVGEFCGWKAINYPALLDDLEREVMNADPS